MGSRPRIKRTLPGRRDFRIARSGSGSVFLFPGKRGRVGCLRVAGNTLFLFCVPGTNATVRPGDKPSKNEKEYRRGARAPLIRADHPASGSERKSVRTFRHKQYTRFLYRKRAPDEKPASRTERFPYSSVGQRLSLSVSGKTWTRWLSSGRGTWTRWLSSGRGFCFCIPGYTSRTRGKPCCRWHC